MPDNSVPELFDVRDEVRVFVLAKFIGIPLGTQPWLWWVDGTVGKIVGEMENLVVSRKRT
jgi:hypothetical protein